MKNLPGPAQRRLMHSILGADGVQSADWLTPARKRMIVAVILLITIALIALVFTHRW